jgi:hypothetical protein
MPLLTRCFVKAALLYLVAGLVVGVLLAMPGAPPVQPVVGVLGPVYFHLLMVGWVTQLIFGVSIWMFPRYSKERPRGPEALGWTALVALNAGLLLRAVAEPVHTLAPRTGWGWLLVLSAALHWVGGLAYVATVWPRVKER